MIISIFITISCMVFWFRNNAVHACGQSSTVASGTRAPARICSGALIFEDDFNTLDFKKWRHEVTLGGSGNWEFQWYANNRSNSFVENGILKIKPTLTADHLGEAALSSVTLDINGAGPGDACTNPAFYGCLRTGSPGNILNPVKSARIRTATSFSFKYGRVEVKAKLPAGDWIWPAIWMAPLDNVYGRWPASGEIDLVESRGNRNYVLNGASIGNQQVSSTLHWGPTSTGDVYERTQWKSHNRNGYSNDFHVYELIWTPSNIKFKVDGQDVGTVAPPAGGFWELGGFDKTNVDNPWKGGSAMAPFDQEFFIIINLAVGGTAFFPDDAANRGGKPWLNTSPKALVDFWNGRDQWLPTWNLGVNDDSYLQVDYVRVYAL